jgi:predicted ABC-type transport system involved in lysophospholipase L1 biosynthesis ATPase subunit
MSMNLSYWLNLRENLLLLAPDRETLKEFLQLVAQFHYQIGIASDAYPLIASLSVQENITLMSMYHQKVSANRAAKAMRGDVEALGMEGKLHLRKEHLRREDILKTYVLRCIAKNNIIILLNTPPLTDLKLVADSLERVGKKLRLWVLCQEDNAAAYRELNLRTISIGG